MGKKDRLLLSLAIIFALLLLASCGGGGDAAADTASSGEELFKQSTIDNTPGCKTCHSLEPDTRIVGPSMAGVATRAGKTVSGLSAEDYLRQSILEPDAYVVEGYPRSVMPNVWSEKLSEDEVNSLVRYLLTLK